MSDTRCKILHSPQRTRYDPRPVNVTVEHAEPGLTCRSRDAVDLTLDGRFFGAVTEGLSLGTSVVNTEADELGGHLRFRFERGFGPLPQTFIHTSGLLDHRFFLGVGIGDLTHHLRVSPDLVVGLVAGVNLAHDSVHIPHVLTVEAFLERFTHFGLVGDFVQLFVQ
ncbi:hypothetical protein D3C84_215780 [compost metagenome]